MSVDVSQLAANFPTGGSYIPTFYQQYPNYPTTNFTAQCLDDVTSQKLAGLLPGAILVRLPVESLQATNGPIPLCNWIQVPDGIVRAADLYQTGSLNCSIPGLSTKCCFEQLLANNVPGGVMGNDCSYQAGYSNPLIQQLSNGQNQLPTAPTYIAPTGGNVNTTNTNTGTSNPTAVANSGNTISSFQETLNTIASQNWLTNFTQIGGINIPNMALAAGGAIVLFMMFGNKGR